jgi:hypothetical protein
MSMQVQQVARVWGLFCTISIFCCLCCSNSVGQVTWDVAADGNWEDGANWSTGAVPQPTDDVVIDQGGGFLITVGSAVPAVNTLSSEEDLSVADDIGLTIENGGSLNGAFTLEGISKPVVDFARSPSSLSKQREFWRIPLR